MMLFYRGGSAAVTSTLIAFSVFAPADTCHAQTARIGSPKAVAGSVTSSTPAQTSPYVGQEKRTVKALSDQEITDILAGRGVGFARPAELNRYPGPLHVLQFKDQLGLSADQIEKVQGIFDQMSRNAKALGRDWVDRERALEASFAGNTITSDQASAETAAIGELQGKLRAVHLRAHIETRAVLTPDQVAKYDALRGYQAPSVSDR